MDMGDETKQMLVRRPLANFVFFPAIQWPQIVRNCLLVLVTSVLAGVLIVALYQWEYGSTSIYVMDRDSAFFPLERSSLISILLPALVGSLLISIGLGWLLAIAASRRIALPIYKVIQWNRYVTDGNLRARLCFRPGDKLDELARSCNNALEATKAGYEDILEVSRDERIPEDLRERLRISLSRYHF